MLNQIKTTVEKSKERLEDLIDKIEDEMESVSEKSQEVWQEARPRLHALKESLVTAEKSLLVKTDEARLQAHLAIMDAQDQWAYLRKPVTEMARHVQQKGQSELQHAELQAHLAKMEARDFLNEKGEQIGHEFQEAKERLEKSSLKAAEELGKSLEDVGSAWANIP